MVREGPAYQQPERGAHTYPVQELLCDLRTSAKACGRKRASPAVPLTGAQIREPRARPGALIYPRQALQHISYLPGLFLARPAPHGGWAHYLPFLCVLRWRSVGRVSQVNSSSSQQPLGVLEPPLAQLLTPFKRFPTCSFTNSFLSCCLRA